jgi:ubiquinone/menaquinone biosynthesis C-methylase UbiE
MNTGHDREIGLERLTKERISKKSQHFIVHHFLRDDIIQATSFAKGKLLDIGCGNKPYRNLFSHITEYIGCDVVQSSENVVDFICPANRLCFNDKEFDTIFSTQVIEHVADFKGMIAESARVIKEGGYAIFTAPFCWELHEEPYDFLRFTKYGLKDSFENAGFEVVKLRANGGKWAALFQLGLNVLFSARKYRTFRSRLISFIFIKLRLIYLYNSVAVWLDKRYFDDILTLNYIIVLRKKQAVNP